MNISEFRQQYPMYSGLSDSMLADQLYSKFYSQMDQDEFLRRFMGPVPDTVFDQERPGYGMTMDITPEEINNPPEPEPSTYTQQPDPVFARDPYKTDVSRYGSVPRFMQPESLADVDPNIAAEKFRVGAEAGQFEDKYGHIMGADYLRGLRGMPEGLMGAAARDSSEILKQVEPLMDLLGPSEEGINDSALMQWMKNEDDPRIKETHRKFTEFFGEIGQIKRDVFGNATNSLDKVAEHMAWREHLSGEIRTLGRPEQKDLAAAYDALSAIPDMAPEIVSGIFGGQKWALGVMATRLFMMEYNRSLTIEGTTKKEAIANAGAVMVTEVLPEIPVFNKLFKRLPEGAQRSVWETVKKLATVSILEGFSEGVTQVMQLADRVFRKGEEIGLDQAIDETLRATETGAMMGPMMGVSVSGAAKAGELYGRIPAVANAQDRKDLETFRERNQPYALMGASDALDPDARQSHQLRYDEAPTGGALPGFDAGFNQASKDLDGGFNIEMEGQTPLQPAPTVELGAGLNIPTQQDPPPEADFGKLDDSEEVGPFLDRQVGPNAQPSLMGGTASMSPPGRSEAPDKSYIEIDLDPMSIQTDAVAFQYKEENTDAEGANQTLAGVTKWNPASAGIIMVWERADGQKFVVDGHQRLALAKRLIDQNPKMLARVYREVDGYRKEDLAVNAAVVNIGQNTGSVVDAAKIIRLVNRLGEVGGQTSESIEEILPKTGAITQHAPGLAKLEENAFQAVVNEVIKPEYGALIGVRYTDPAQQMAAINALAKTKPETLFQANDILDQMDAAGFSAGQADIFGDTLAESYFKERAKIVEQVGRRAKNKRSLYGGLIRNEGQITGVGKNRIDTKTNQRLVDTQDTVLSQIGVLTRTDQEINNVLNQQAKLVGTGQSTLGAASDVIEQAITGYIERGGPAPERAAGIPERDGADAEVPSGGQAVDGGASLEADQGQQAQTVETDPVKVQKIRNSIAEGKMILVSGRNSNGKKYEPEALEAIRRSVNSSLAKIGEASLPVEETEQQQQAAMFKREETGSPVRFQRTAPAWHPMENLYKETGAMNSPAGKKIDWEAKGFGQKAPKHVIPEGDPLLTETYKLEGREENFEKMVLKVLGDTKPATAEAGMHKSGKPLIIFIAGGSANGKGTIIDQQLDNHTVQENTLYLNPDSVKVMIGEYNRARTLGDSRAGTIVHVESTNVVLEALRRAMEMGANIVYDTSMSHEEAGFELLDELTEAGYYKKMIGVTIPAEEAVARAYLREEGGGRAIPLKHPASSTVGFSRNWKRHKEAVDEILLYSNMVAEDGQMAFLAWTRPGKEDAIFYPEEYDAFIDMALQNPEADTLSALSTQAYEQRQTGKSTQGNGPADSRSGAEGAELDRAVDTAGEGERAGGGSRGEAERTRTDTLRPETQAIEKTLTTTVNEFKSSKGKNVFGIPRLYMPQVEDLDAFEAFLKARGIKVTRGTTIPVTDLIPTQKELIEKSVTGITGAVLRQGKTEILEREIIVTETNHIADGHHRYETRSRLVKEQNYSPDQPVFIVHTDALNLLIELARQFEGTSFSGTKNVGYTDSKGVYHKVVHNKQPGASFKRSAIQRIGPERTDPGRVTTASRRLISAIQGRAEKALADDAIVQVDGDPALAGQVRAIKKAFGKNVVFFRRNTNDIFGFEGVIINGNTIYINETLQNPFTATVFHELLHQLRINRPDLYRQLASAAITSTTKQKFSAFRDAMNKVTDSNKERRMTNDLILEELLADSVADAFLDPEFLTALATENPGKFKEIMDTILEYLNNIMADLRGKDMGTSQFYKDVEGLRSTMAEVLNEYAEGVNADGKAEPKMQRTSKAIPTQKVIEGKKAKLSYFDKNGYLVGVRKKNSAVKILLTEDMSGGSKYRVTFMHQGVPYGHNEYNYLSGGPQEAADDIVVAEAWEDDPLYRDLDEAGFPGFNAIDAFTDSYDAIEAKFQRTTDFKKKTPRSSYTIPDWDLGDNIDPEKLLATLKSKKPTYEIPDWKLGENVDPAELLKPLTKIMDRLKKFNAEMPSGALFEIPTWNLGKDIDPETFFKKKGKGPRASYTIPTWKLGEDIDPDSIRFSFGGAFASTANLDKLHTAEDRAAAERKKNSRNEFDIMGREARSIWKDTGWFMMPDNQWRFEISDADAEMKRSEKNHWYAYDDFAINRESEPHEQQDSVGLPGLYAAYPALRGVILSVDPNMMNASGSYSEDTLVYGNHRPGHIKLAARKRPRTDRGFKVEDDSAFEALSILLHENTHAIQHTQEHFAKGGSINGMGVERATREFAIKHYNGLLSVLAKRMDTQQRGSESYKETKAEFDAAMESKLDIFERNKALLKYSLTESYLRLHGEAEARMVEKRLARADSGNAKIYPLDDLDVNPEELIVRFQRSQFFEHDYNPSRSEQPDLLQGPSAKERLKAAQKEVNDRLTGLERGRIEMDEGAGDMFSQDPTTAGQQELRFKRTVKDLIDAGVPLATALAASQAHSPYFMMQDILKEVKDMAPLAYERAIAKYKAAGAELVEVAEAITAIGLRTRFQRSAIKLRGFTPEDQTTEQTAFLKEYGEDTRPNILFGSKETADGTTYTAEEYAEKVQMEPEWISDVNRIYTIKGKGFYPAFITLRAQKGNVIYLSGIEVFDKFTGKGYGSAVLQFLTDTADKHGVILEGDIEPFGSKRMNITKLKDWYKRNGFTVKGRKIHREPQTAKFSRGLPIMDYMRERKQRKAEAEAEDFRGAEEARHLRAAYGDAALSIAINQEAPAVVREHLESEDPAGDYIRYQRTGSSNFDNWTLPSMSLRQALHDDELSFWQSLDEGTKKIRLTARQELQDRMIPVLRVIEAVQDSGSAVSDFMNVYERESLIYGRVGDRFEQLERNILEPMLKLAARAGISNKEIGEYLYALHAPSRNAMIRTRSEYTLDEDGNIVPDNVSGSGMSDEEAAKIIKRVESGPDAATFKRLVKYVREITEATRQNYEDYQLLMPEVLEAWKDPSDFNKTYVPLKGWEQAPEDETFGTTTGKGMDIRGDEVRRALGRKSKAGDILSNITADYKASLIRGEKNAIGRGLYDLAKANPNPELWGIGTFKMRKEFDKKTGMVVERIDLGEIRNSDEVFMLKIDGKAKWVRLKDPRLLKAMKNLGAEQLDMVTRQFAGLNRWLSIANTMLNPEFLVNNFFKDIQTAAIKLTADELKEIRKKAIGVKPIKRSIAAMFKELSGRDNKDREYGKYAREFKKDGAHTDYFRQLSIEQYAKNLDNVMSLYKDSLWGTTRRGGKALKDLVEDANGAVENGVRLSTYIELRKAGVSRQKAAAAAKNLTVNFNRKGVKGAVINSYYLFANAGIQGVHLAGATLKTKTGRRVWAGLGVAGAMTALWGQLLGGDDEDGISFYDKLSDWERERNWILMIPPAALEYIGESNIPFLSKVMEGEKDTGGRYLKFPLPWVYNIPYVMGDALIGTTMFGEKPTEAATRTLLAINNSINPVGDNTLLGMVAPTFMDPALQVMDNMNFWGGNIYKPKYPGDESPESSDSYYGVAPAWKKLAETLNKMGGGDQWRASEWSDFHPETLRHWFRHFTGGAGSFVNRVGENISAALYGTDIPMISGDEPLQPEKLIYLRKVYGRVWKGADSNQYYEHRKELTELAGEYKSRKESAKLGGDGAAILNRFKRTNRSMLGTGEHEKIRNRCQYRGGGMLGELKGADCKISKLRSERNLLRERPEQTRKVKDRIRATDDRVRQIQRAFNKRWNDKYLDRGWFRTWLEEDD